MPVPYATYQRNFAPPNPFASLKYNGHDDKLHAAEFIKRFVDLVKYHRLPDHEALYLLGNSLQAQPATWWSVMNFDSFEQAVKGFRSKYWSASAQVSFRADFAAKFYEPKANQTMSDYVYLLYRINSNLDTPMDEHTFVKTIIGHFPRDVIVELRPCLHDKLENLTRTLDEIDNDLKIEERRQKLLNQIEKTKTDAPAKKPWSRNSKKESTQSSDSPNAPSTAKQNTSQQTKSRKKENFAKKQANAKADDASPRTEKPSSQPEPSSSQKTQPRGRSATRDRSASRARSTSRPRAKDAAPTKKQEDVATLTLDSNATISQLETSNTSEFEIKVTQDGRPAINLDLVWKNHTWPVEAMLDTGATISIISSEVLDEFSHHLANTAGVTKPRGGFFRTIKILKANFSSPFHKKSGQASFKANLEIRLENVDNVHIHANHIFYVTGKMSKQMIIGTDFLRKYLAMIAYVTYDTAYLTTAINGPQTETAEAKGNSTQESAMLTEDPDKASKSDHRQVDTLPRTQDLSYLSEDLQAKIRDLLDKHAELLDGTLGCIEGYEHVIEMRDDKPHKPRKFPVPLKYLDEVRRQISEMESMGVIMKDATEYINPLVVALRANGKIRICLDARAVNEKMRNDHAQPLTIEEVLARIGDRRVYTKIDINQAYWQVPLHEDSIKYTGFIFDGQSYVFLRMPFGLKTASASFTRALDIAIAKVPHLQPNLTVYLDDILVASDSCEEQIQQLDQLFEALESVGIKLNRDKCEFLTPKVQFLGHDLSMTTIEMTSATKEAIEAFSRPRCKKEIQQFLGLVNWDRRFVPNLSELTKPLEELLQKGQRFRWTMEREKAFTDIKREIRVAKTLFLLRKDLPYGLETDASCVGLGARLYQFEPNDETTQYTIAYASRSLKAAEKNYTTTEQEGLALAWALDKFRIILTGRTVHIKTDHRALTFLGSCATNSRRIARWMELFGQFDLRMKHIPGATNTLADTLSRHPAGRTKSAPENKFKEVNDKSQPSDPEQQLHDELALIELDPYEEIDPARWTDWIVNAQQDDETVRQLPETDPDNHTTRNNLIRRITNKRDSDRIVVPDAIKWQLINKIHKHLVHFGTDKIVDFAKAYFHIVNLDVIARDVVASCEICQATKTYTRPTVGPQYYEHPQETGEITSVDLYGPLPQSRNGNKYVLVLLDLFSKHTALYALKNQKIDTIADIIENKYVTRRGFSPMVFLTDCGGQFITAKWRRLAEKVGSRTRRTAPYNPQSNPVERVMREIGRVLRAYSHHDHLNWDVILPRLESVINNTTHSSTGYTPLSLEFDNKWYNRRSRTNREHNDLYIAKMPDELLPDDLLRQRTAPVDHRQRRTNRREQAQNCRANIRKADAKRRIQADKHDKVVNPYANGELVWRKVQKRSDAAHKKTKKLYPLYEGPLEIVDSPHLNTYLLRWPDGRSAGVSNTRQLRPYRRSKIDQQGPHREEDPPPDEQRRPPRQSTPVHSESSDSENEILPQKKTRRGSRSSSTTEAPVERPSPEARTSKTTKKTSDPPTRTKPSRKKRVEETPQKENRKKKSKPRRSRKGSKASQRPTEDPIEISDSDEPQDEDPDFVISVSDETPPITISESSHSQKSLSPILEETDEEDESSNETNPSRPVYTTTHGDDYGPNPYSDDELDEWEDADENGRFKPDGPYGYPKEYYDSKGLTGAEVQDLVDYVRRQTFRQLRDEFRKTGIDRRAEERKAKALYEAQLAEYDVDNENSDDDCESTNHYAYREFDSTTASYHAPPQLCNAAETATRREDVINSNPCEKRPLSPDRNGMSSLEYLQSLHENQQVIQDIDSQEVAAIHNEDDLDFTTDETPTQPSAVRNGRSKGPSKKVTFGTFRRIHEFDKKQKVAMDDDSLEVYFEVAAIHLDDQDFTIKQEPVSDPEGETTVLEYDSSLKLSGYAIIKEEPMEPSDHSPMVEIPDRTDSPLFITWKDDLWPTHRDSPTLYSSVCQRSAPLKSDSKTPSESVDRKRRAKRKRPRKAKGNNPKRVKFDYRSKMSDNEDNSDEERKKRQENLRRELQHWVDRKQRATQAYNNEEQQLKRRVENSKRQALHKEKMLSDIRQIMSYIPPEDSSTSKESLTYHTAIMDTIEPEPRPSTSKQREITPNREVQRTTTEPTNSDSYRPSDDEIESDDSKTFRQKRFANPRDPVHRPKDQRTGKFIARKKKVTVDTTITLVTAPTDKPSTSGTSREKRSKTTKNRPKRTKNASKSKGIKATSTPFVQLERIPLTKQMDNEDDPTCSTIKDNDTDLELELARITHQSPEINVRTKPPIEETILTPSSKSTPSPSFIDNFPYEDFLREGNMSRPLFIQQPGPSQQPQEKKIPSGRPTIVQDEPLKDHVVKVQQSLNKSTPTITEATPSTSQQRSVSLGGGKVQPLTGLQEVVTGNDAAPGPTTSESWQQDQFEQRLRRILEMIGAAESPGHVSIPGGGVTAETRAAQNLLRRLSQTMPSAEPRVAQAPSTVEDLTLPTDDDTNKEEDRRP